MIQNDSSTLDKALYKTIKTMLKPLVKLLLQQGITYTALVEPLKQIFVEVAEESFPLANKKQTDSRISLLTGVHRKEVKRLRETDNSLSAQEIKAGISAQIMATWTGHPDFLNADGFPSALPKQGPSPSFEDLVFRVSKDKHPRSVLDDWINQGIVTLDEKNFVHLNEAGFVPQDNLEEKLFFAGKNINAHLTVVAHNLSGDDRAMFDRAVFYKNLSEDSIQKIEQTARDKSLSLLTEINMLGLELQQQDQSNKTATSEFHFGSYFLCDDKTENTENKDA